MQSLHVSFGPPVHGWMHFALASADGKVEFEFSHVPYDSLGDLAAQLRAVHENGLSCTVRFCCEPSEFEFHLESSWPGRTRLTVKRWPAAARTASGQVMLESEGAADDIALAFWRAFRRLQADHFAGGTSPHWNRPFPGKDVELLGRSLGR